MASSLRTRTWTQRQVSHWIKSTRTNEYMEVRVRKQPLGSSTMMSKFTHYYKQLHPRDWGISLSKILGGRNLDFLGWFSIKQKGTGEKLKLSTKRNSRSQKALEEKLWMWIWGPDKPVLKLHHGLPVWLQTDTPLGIHLLIRKGKPCLVFQRAAFQANWHITCLVRACFENWLLSGNLLLPAYNPSLWEVD